MREKKCQPGEKTKNFLAKETVFLFLPKRTRTFYTYFILLWQFSHEVEISKWLLIVWFLFFLLKWRFFFFSQFPSGLAPSLLSMGANLVCAGAEGGAPVRTIIKNQWRLTKSCICIVYVDRCAASAYIYKTIQFNAITFFMAELHKIQHSRWHHITPCTPAFIERHHH